MPAIVRRGKHYIFALAVLVVTGARLGDSHGHRTMFFLGLFGFTAASLACGLAPTGAVLVAARICQGAAAALLLPQVLSLIQLSFEGAARARALGLYSMVLALGVALGQVAGGVIVTLGGSWRPIFLVNVPVGAVLLVIGPRLMPPEPRRSVRLDLPGVVLLPAAWARSSYRWYSAGNSTGRCGRGRPSRRDALRSPSSVSTS
ncbi:MFS transporter [Actinomadura coerulea]|uniref:MFS transporter n=1 Tax=Actinomadura coerulea TaxID=46159 RepID=UPI003427B692